MKQTILISCVALAMLGATSVRADRNRESPDRGHGQSRGFVAGGVYTMDNAAAGNNVWAFPRLPDGTLGAASLYPTGGQGTGAGLGNQGAVQLSDDGRWLFVCNAGSDEISVFAVRPHGLVLADKAGSGGQQPISIALHRNLVYVLNAGGAISGGADNIAGFEFKSAHLMPLAGSTHNLSADATAPADIAFTHDGQNVVVTEKATGFIDTFQLGDHGMVTGSQSFMSPVPTPFGFASGRRDRIFVTEANGGAANPGGSSVTSYQVNDDGSLDIISQSVPTHQTAACWIILSQGERFAYAANTPNDSFSSFRVGRDGSLELLESQAAVLASGSGPVDMALSRGGRFLYSLNPGNGTVGMFKVNPATGALDALSGTANVPVTANGLAAR